MDYLLKADGTVMAFEKMPVKDNTMLIELTGAIGFYWPASYDTGCWFCFMQGTEPAKGGEIVNKSHVPHAVLMTHLLVS